MKGEDKLARLVDCLQKTPPPVLVFSEKTRDVDMVHEYLLTRGVNAVAIHGAHLCCLISCCCWGWGCLRRPLRPCSSEC